MKYFPSLLTLLTVSFCFAQPQPADLYVSDNAASYIYVDGTAFNNIAGTAPLYVTNDIDLEGTNSFIYLRNEAQLLQGNNIGNSGTGQLSVQQSGNVNQWAYNYWCSPVGNNLLDTNENEDFRASLIDESTGLISSQDADFIAGYNGISSPLQIPRRWLFTFEISSNYADWVYVGETGAIKPGLGFTMKGMGTATFGNQLYDFRGKPNNGTITNNIAAGQFTLIGNPYPSAIDALALIHDPQNTNLNSSLPTTTTGVLHYWEQTPTEDHFIANYIGGYALYTISSTGVDTFVYAVFSAYDGSGTPIPAPPGPPGGTKVAGRYIPIGQGFMVEGSPTTPAGALVYLKNEFRVFRKESSGDSFFFRSSEIEDPSPNVVEYNEFGLNIVPADFKRFRINVILNNEYTRQLVHNFHATATDGFDYGLEAKNPEVLSSDSYWVVEDNPYVVKADEFDLDLKIPLVIEAEHQQPLNFSIFDVQNFDGGQPIYLHDIEARLFIDLRTQNYNINIPAGIYTNRFEITFTTDENTLNSPEVTIDDFKIFQNNPQSQLTIINPNGFDVKNVKMFDTSGKQIFDAGNLTNEAEYHFTTKTLSEGIYVATITLGTNEVVSKKVIVKN